MRMVVPPVARALRRHVPALRRRDDRIAALTRRNQALEHKLARASQRAARRPAPALPTDTAEDQPSFRRYVQAERRITLHLRDQGSVSDRAHLVTHKLRSYTLATSHGIRVPRVLGLWDDLDAIRLDALPDAVVVKSNGGANSRGVLPMRREGHRWRVVGGTTTLSRDDVVERLRSLEAERAVAGPYFAEELLDGGSGALPLDVKVYAFHGEVGHVMLRSVGDHLDARSHTFRLVLPDGSDPGPIYRPRSYDPGIPVPETLDRILEVARVLSRAVPLPFVRVDLYAVGDEVVLGELTPRPGGKQDHGPEHDVRLGRLWERALARRTDALIAAGANQLRFGPHPRELVVGDARVRFDAPPG